MLNGKKTYIVAALTAVWAVTGYFLGKVDLISMVNDLLGAGALVGIRSALNK